MLIKDIIEFSARYEVMRGGGVYKRIYPADDPEINCVSSSALKMSIRGAFYRDDFEDINFLTDRIRAVVTINGVDYPCGHFVVTSEEYRKTGGLKTVAIEGYSPLYLAERKKIETRLSIPAGTNYVAQINSLLMACGITNIISTPTSLTMATAREDWEIGTPYLTIINDLLAEINYNSAWVDLNGAVHITPYAAPSLANVTHTYTAGQFSLIGEDYTLSNDMHSKCNVFLVICSNPDLGAPMSATAEITDPSVPFSTVNIGRVLSVTQVDNTPNQTVLQNTANMLRTKALLTTQTITFETAINPTHSSFNVLALDNDELSGLFEETEWSMVLSPSANMKHKARRVIA